MAEISSKKKREYILDKTKAMYDANDKRNQSGRPDVEMERLDMGLPLPQPIGKLQIHR